MEYGSADFNALLVPILRPSSVEKAETQHLPERCLSLRILSHTELHVSVSGTFMMSM